MSTEFSLDLRKVRRVAGLRQEDVAHLMGISSSSVSRLEKGQRRPSLVQIVTLSLIFGRSFESFFSTMMEEVKGDLRRRILSLPEAGRAYVGIDNRQHTIDRLAQFLAAEEPEDGA